MLLTDIVQGPPTATAELRPLGEAPSHSSSRQAQRHDRMDAMRSFVDNAADKEAAEKAKVARATSDRVRHDLHLSVTCCCKCSVCSVTAIRVLYAIAVVSRTTYLVPLSNYNGSFYIII